MRLHTIFADEDIKILRTECVPVATSEFGHQLTELTDEMFAIMAAHKGIGLAAPQVGLAKRLMVVEIPHQIRQVFINPKIEILPASPAVCCFEEGCLSIPGFSAEVERPSRIMVTAFDSTGRRFSLEADELLSVCIQHECDHLDGVLFVDHLSKVQQRCFWDKVAAKGFPCQQEES